MRILCPHCRAEEGRDDDVPLACRAHNAERRLLFARANGSDVESLRAEVESLRHLNTKGHRHAR